MTVGGLPVSVNLIFSHDMRLFPLLAFNGSFSLGEVQRLFQLRQSAALSSLVLFTARTFDALKGTIRHFSLIPPGGGGILSHSLASIASWLKVKEVDQSGDGIESLINRVESLLAEGKLYEAADTLENGVKDCKVGEILGDWIRRARNRAITEQALTVLQSYATSISLT
ncbi:hypothetical protein F511_34655 [Dorcoceras hygrometricum]|uniref:Uncharacterized protein n=1 Tax=Dorcoceras hygrometricum TaxID=472368 RepID=A0A2Z7BXH1_9LAMI|nr:hypothetical protein F511_34655 [Dorcoceras hygrometricum]